MSEPLPPVLLITFNRPDYTKKVLSCLKEAGVSKLYVANDGPRDGNSSDEKNCDAVRNLIGAIDWDCEVFSLFSDRNKGCQLGVVSAIDWFFQNVDEGIILEDDIIPANEFFKFCSIMLKKYRTKKQVMAVLGFNYHGQNIQSDQYFFYEGFYPWGWATWKKSWEKYSNDRFDLEKLRQMKKRRPSHKNLYASLHLNLSLVRAKILDTWDYQFLYMMADRGGLSVAPYANLTTNIGVDGAHSYNNVLGFNYGTFEVKNLKHPAKIKICDKMNYLFLHEHHEGRRKIQLKRIILILGFYGPLKRLRNLHLKWRSVLSAI